MARRKGRSSSALTELAGVLFLILSLSQEISAQIVFTSAPSDVIVAVGTQAEFNCQATSSNSLSIVWRKGTTVVTPTDRITISITGLTINPTVADDAGTYTCTATDQVTQASDSRSAMLTFASITNSFVINPIGQMVSEGGSLLLFCLHSGSLPAAQITWIRDGTALTTGGRVSISSDVLTHASPPQTTSSLSITSILPSESGSYMCRATNSLLPDQPIDSSVAVVTVQALPRAPTITQHPSNTFAPAAGQAATMYCTASGQPPPTITWLHNGSPVTADSVLITSTSSFNSTLTVLSVQTEDEGMYQCSATNSLGTVVSNNATLYIAFIDLAFQLEPSDTFGVLGQAGLINCQPPNSVPPAVVQWLKDSSPITDSRFTVASNGSLLISSVMSVDSGQYICTATNEPLNIIRSSSPVQFPVYIFPNITQSPSPVTLTAGGNFTLTCVTTGTPSPVTTWLRDGTTVAQDPGHIQILPNEIIVTGATVNDDGVYRCEATNPAGTTHAEAVVDVIPFPSFDLTSDTVSAIVGSSVVLPCHANPDPSLSFSWSLAGQQLPQQQVQSNGGLSIASVAESNEGVYTCVATNTLGSAQGTVQLTVNAPPTAVAAQSSVTATEGQTAQLVCTVTGDPSPTVTWQSGGVAIPNSNTATITTQNNGATLVFSPVQLSNAGSYQCTASNGVGSPASANLTLSINVPPAVSVSPTSLVTVQGSDVEFDCQASGDPSPSVTWLTGTSVNVELLNNDRIEVVNNTLMIQNVTSDEEGQYMCRATSAIGTATVSVTLTVNFAPIVSLSPMFTITQGASLTLDCQVSGSPTPSIMWFKDGAPLTGNNRITVGDTVSIAGAFSSDAGTYMCQAENSIGNSTASTVLSVIVLPLITVPNPMVTANESTTALLECNAVGTPTPTISWFKDSVPLPSSSYPGTSIAANNSLIVTSVMMSDEGVYVCQASNTGGTESATVTLNVNTFPRVTASQTAITVSEGNSATLSCTATGDPFPTLSWLRNGVIIQPGTTGFQFLASGQTLVIGTVLESAHEGEYTCRATNFIGTATALITLNVLVPPSFSPQPSDSIGVEHTAHTLTCSAVGDPTPQIQWSRNGVVLSVTNTLTFQSLSRTDAGSYTCTATNIAAFTQATIQLNVFFVPAITVPPTSLSVPLSSSASFSCVANGNPQPQFTWFQNGLPIPGATSSTYTIAMTTANSPGTYSCQATNPVGMATANATLTVIFPPSAPIILSTTVLSSTSIALQWSPPLSDGGNPVSSYLVEYRPHTDLSAPYVTTSLPPTQLAHIILNLLPFTEYDIRVRGVNIAGPGNQSDIMNPLPVTHADYPVAPGNLRINSSTLSSLTLSWDTPSPLNGPLGVYELRYTVDQSQPLTILVFKTTFTITSIQADTTYHYSIRAATIGQLGGALWGPYSNDIWVRNGMEVGEPSPPPTTSTLVMSTPSPDMSSTELVAMPAPSSTAEIIAPEPSSTPVPEPSSTPIPEPSVTPTPILNPPSATPASLQLFTPTSGQIIAVWQPPTTGSGTFDGYHLYISPPAPTLSLPLTISLSMPTSIVFNMLSDFTEYTVSVATFNNDGDSPLVTESVTTHEGVPSSPLQVSVEVQTGADSLLVSWETPAMPNGVIIQYSVVIRNTATSEQVSTFVTPSLPMNSTQSTIITNLSPLATYQVTVTAQTQVGTGPPSQVVTVTLLEPTTSLVPAMSSTPLSSPATTSSTGTTIVTLVSSTAPVMSTTVATSSTEEIAPSVTDFPDIDDTSSVDMIEMSLTDVPSSSLEALPPTVTLSPSQSVTNGTDGADLGAGFYAGIIVAVVLVVFILVAIILIIATLIQYRNRDNKKWAGNYNISPSATAELNALELEPSPLINNDEEDDDGESENHYVAEPQDHGFTLTATKTADQQRLLDSELELREAAEEPDDDIQPSPLPARPVYNPGDQSMDEMNRNRARKAKKRGVRMRGVPDDDMVPLDSGDMPETKIGETGTSLGDYTGAADMY